MYDKSILTSMETSDSGVHHTKVDLFEYIPDRCNDCPIIGRYATWYALLLANEQLTSTRRRALARLAYSLTGSSCPNGIDESGDCGSREAESRIFID